MTTYTSMTKKVDRCSCHIIGHRRGRRFFVVLKDARTYVGKKTMGHRKNEDLGSSECA